MPQRNSGNKVQLPNVVLRRSPRSIQIKQPDSQLPKTPNEFLRRSPRFHQIKPPDSDRPITPFLKEQTRTRVQSSKTPLTSTGTKILKRTSKSTEKVSEQFKESNTQRRSRILNRLPDVSKNIEVNMIMEKVQGESNRPMTRSCCRYPNKIANTNDNCGSGKPIRHKTEESVSKNLVKDIKKYRNDDCDRADEIVSDDKMNKGAVSMKEVKVHDVLDVELPEKQLDKLEKKTESRVDQMPTKVGIKRKRNHGENDARISKGWSKDQEMALERAYLIANPTPHFWKKVSRMVPGKSAQECFDKIHCNHLTPPQRPPRPRTKGLISKNNNLSASKLLDSSSQKTKKPRQRKQKSHILQRTVRHMLQKQHNVEQDLFSVIEPSLNHNHNQVITTTPDCNKFKGLEGSSTVYKKSGSRLSNLYETPIVSPPVLKQVKNLALHEKYIDRLNCRDANRKRASLKEGNLHRFKDGSSVKRKDAIKAAKFALVYDAKNAINEFQDQQMKALSSIFDDESDED